MAAIQIFGSRPLEGEIQVQGSKNAVLPIMAAALLCPGITVLRHVPRIQDVFCMISILESLGCKTTFRGNELIIDAAQVTNSHIPKDHVCRMRSSIMVLGPLLGRLKEASTYYPGGCTIGERPINLHFEVLKALGVEIYTDGECIRGAVKNLTGGDITLSFPSVGATENAVMAAVKAEGVTRIFGCAREPEIIELCKFLVQMGADIKGIGESCLYIRGVKTLKPTEYQIVGDRIVAGTYMAAAVATRGQLTIKGISTKENQEVLRQFVKMGADVRQHVDEVRISMDKRPAPIPFLCTAPYPAFPTDMQSQIMAVLTIAGGVSMIEENIFEGRFETAAELRCMGADIYTEGSRAIIHGVKRLKGASVEAKDLRGGAALVIAALSAEGVTRIENCCHILRGYEGICRDLTCLGGRLEYLTEVQ